MAIQVYFWKDGTISVTRDGGPYNSWTEMSVLNCKAVEIQEPETSDDEPLDLGEE